MHSLYSHSCCWIDNLRSPNDGWDHQQRTLNVRTTHRHDLWKRIITPLARRACAEGSSVQNAASALSTPAIRLPINGEPRLAGQAARTTVRPCHVLCPLAVLPPLSYDPQTVTAWIIDLTNSHLWSSTEWSLRVYRPKNLLAKNHSWVIFEIQKQPFRYNICMSTNDSNNILTQIQN